MKIPSLLSQSHLLLKKPLTETMSLLTDRISTHSKKSKDEISEAIIQLVGAVIWADGEIEDSEIEEFRRYLASRYTDSEIDAFVEKLKIKKEYDLSRSFDLLRYIPHDERNRILSILLNLAYSNGNYSDEERARIEEIAEGLAVSKEYLAHIEEKLVEERKRREQILKSGTGIFTAFAVIFIFILTATFLKSVLFGIILAYIFLPLERWYEYKFFENSVVKKIIELAHLTIVPFIWLRQFFSSTPPEVLTEEQLIEKQKNINATRATSATILTSIIGILLTLFILFLVVFPYVSNLSTQIKGWADERVYSKAKVGKLESKVEHQPQQHMETSETAVKGEDKGTTIEGKPVVLKVKGATGKVKLSRDDYFKGLYYSIFDSLKGLQPKIKKMPGISWAIAKVETYIKDKDNQESLIKMALTKTGGIFSFTMGLTGQLSGLLFDVLLSIFFYFYFLQKIAVYSTNSKRDKKTPGEYLVNSIFNTSWMPKTSKETRLEAIEILDTIVRKIRVWIRGYVGIIAIEMIIYILLFSLLGVPYPIILGGIAGCTVLLPFIGPLASGALTILVCLAVGHVSMIVIILILGVYGFMNVVVEQLFLYPTMIGEALGLNSVETVIVVLLGGVFAGISGMIFAVPAAAILKYLIPKIYIFLGGQDIRLLKK